MRRDRRAFTLVELLVVISIIAVLAAILFPTLSIAKAKAQQAKCISNLRQIAIALELYAQDHEIYPDAQWTMRIVFPKEALKCPMNDALEVGYGMNAYLCSMKNGLVSRPSDIIAVADSLTQTTVSADMKRHGNYACFARLDGSAVAVKKQEDAGRWACGKFPILPKVLFNGQESVEVPSSFVEHQNVITDFVTNEFVFAGPYGDGKGDGVTMTAGVPDMNSLPYIDYIKEGLFITQNADTTPLPGQPAPGQLAIVDPLPTDTPYTAGKPVNLYKKWTVVKGTEGVNSLQNVLNYNCKFPNRTTYALTYVFSPVKQRVTMECYNDDCCIVWLNGGQIAINLQPNDGTKPTAMANNIDIPQGISFLVVKLVNGTLGMKFKLRFMGAGSNQYPPSGQFPTYNPLTAPLSFSPTL